MLHFLLPSYFIMTHMYLPTFLELSHIHLRPLDESKLIQPFGWIWREKWFRLLAASINQLRVFVGLYEVYDNFWEIFMQVGVL